MIKVIEGNILNAEEDIICHQVNCKGVMGAGLAKQIRSKYSLAYIEYVNYCNSKDDKQELLGDVQVVKVSKDKNIANIFSQFSYGRGERQTNYIALEKALRKLKDISFEWNKSIALPYGIGCGLAGGNWDVVYKIIEEVFDDYNVTLYKFK